MMSADQNNSRASKRQDHTPTNPHPAEAEERSPVLPDVTEQLALRAHQEAVLDEAIEETFPASDPISPIWVRQTKS